jgi:hypothetical protein
MTNLPDDQIDPYESRLTRRVGAFAEQAIRPIDAAAIATAAHAGARRATLAGRFFGSAGPAARLGLVFAGAILAAAAFGIYVGSGGNVFPPATSAVPAASATEVPGAARACDADALTASISAWDGAAGHRIATVDVVNRAKFDCTLPDVLRPALVDADGHALIVAAPASASTVLHLAAGSGSVTASVDMANYCGASPTAALRIRLYLPNQSSIEAAAVSGLEPLDAPPCNGPNVPATIEMQAFVITGG